LLVPVLDIPDPADDKDPIVPETHRAVTAAGGAVGAARREAPGTGVEQLDEEGIPRRIVRRIRRMAVPSAHDQDFSRSQQRRGVVGAPAAHGAYRNEGARVRIEDLRLWNGRPHSAPGHPSRDPNTP